MKRLRRNETRGICPRIRTLALALALWLCVPLAVAQISTKAPEQVQVSVKIIEFQTTKGVNSGLSAFFQRLPKALPFGRVDIPGSSIGRADLTFPTDPGAAITVFLDRIHLGEGDVEMVLQGLVDANRAFILSRPRAMVKVAEPIPTIIETTQEVPYESTVVVGSTAVQVTSFEKTGVILKIQVPEIIDDDGDWGTSEDTYIRLQVEASVKKEGQRRRVALGTTAGTSAITVPEFISRHIQTHVWVRAGQVLMLGGLYHNTESRSLSTLPWLAQGEDVAAGLAERVIPGNASLPRVSPLLGNRRTSESRRELVFLIKSEIWRPFRTVADMMDFDSPGETKTRRAPKDVITETLDKISDFPRSLFRKGQEPAEAEVKSSLGRRD